MFRVKADGEGEGCAKNIAYALLTGNLCSFRVLTCGGCILTEGGLRASCLCSR